MVGIAGCFAALISCPLIDQEASIIAVFLRSQAGRQLMLYGGGSFLWILVQILHWFGRIPFLDGELSARLTLYGVLITIVLFFQLSRAFLRDPGQFWIAWLLGAVWLGVFAFFETGVFGLLDQESRAAFSFPRSGAALSVLMTGWACFMAYVILVAARSFRTALHHYARNRCRLWFWPVLFTLLSDLSIFVWSIWYLRSFDSRLTTSAGLASTPAIGAWLAEEPGPAALAMVFLLTGYSLHLISAGLSAGIVVSQLLPRAHYNTQRTLREYSLSISNILDPELLATVAIGLINEAFEIQRGYLFLVEYEKEENVYRMRGTKGMGKTLPPPGMLPAGSPVIAYFIHQRNPLSQFALDHLEPFNKISPEEQAWYRSLGADIYIPIYAKEEWIGLLVLGPKVSGAFYGEEELEFLGILADQTAVALHNARLVESLTRLNNQYRRMYSALERANHQLERLDRTKSDFISIASHELRTPLSVIRGYSEILIDETAIKTNPYYAKMLSGIHAGILRLHEIVESMLDMASIDTRTLELNREPVSIHVMVRMILEGIKKSGFDRKLEIQVADMRDLPQVNADPEALRKVFTHLILNAIKFTPDGGKIEISGRALAPGVENLPEGGVEVLVCDTGIGIAAEVQELIFTKFYQTGKLNLHSSGKTKFKGGGQGLGLAIARGIVDAHGGKIWVESTGYDEQNLPGSKFHVVLPQTPIH